MSAKNELYEVRKLLENIQEELDMVKKSLNQFFTREEQVILAYEAAIGRSETQLEVMSQEEIVEYARECQEYLQFCDEVDACLTEELPQKTAVRVGRIPAVLREAGCEDIDMYVTQKHLRNIVHSAMDTKTQYHEIEARLIKQLPELLSRPLAVMEDRRDPDTLVVVLNAKDSQGRQIVVPIRTGGEAFYHFNRVAANFVLSVYGKASIAYTLQKAAMENRIRYIDKKKSTTLEQKQPRLLQSLSPGTFEDIVQQTGGNVNTLGKNPQEAQRQIAKEAAPESPKEVKGRIR